MWRFQPGTRPGVHGGLSCRLSDKQKWALTNFAGDADGKVYDNAVTAAASVIFHFVALSGDFWQASQAWSANFLVRVNEQEGKEDDRSPLHFLHLHRNDTCKQWSQLKTRTRGFADWIDDAQLRGTHTAYNNYLCVAYPDWLVAGMPSYEDVPRLRVKYEKSKGGTLTWALADKAGWQSAVKGVEVRGLPSPALMGEFVVGMGCRTPRRT